MNRHEFVATLPAKERELFYLQHQQGRGIGPVIAEKNLGLLADGPHLLAAQLASACVFKGGTSRSKVFDAIERHSGHPSGDHSLGHTSVPANGTN